MEIILNDKTYIAPRPKAEVWRKVMKFDEERLKAPNIGFVDAHIDIIALAFNNPELSTETLSKDMYLDDVLPQYFDIFEWICGLLNSKLGKIPNVETPVAD